jgi:hypothetical protein
MKVTMNGVTYNVEGTDDPEVAIKHATEFAQQDLNKKAQTEYDQAGMAKPLMAAEDVLRTTLDTATLGGADRFANWMRPPIPGEPTHAQITKAVRSRMGGADVAADVATTMAAAPTAVPKIVGMLGGGPIARALTGGATAATEGGILGGTKAYIQDKPIAEGVTQGATAGAGGQAAAGLLTKPINAAANWFTGANKTLPPITGAQFKQASKIVGDDPMTKVFSYLGGAASALPGMAAAASIPHYIATKAGGKVADFIANQGRREKVDNMRRMVMGEPRVKGPLSDEEKLALGLRGRFADYLEE